MAQSPLDGIELKLTLTLMLEFVGAVEVVLVVVHALVVHALVLVLGSLQPLTPPLSPELPHNVNVNVNTDVNAKNVRSRAALRLLCGTAVNRHR
ncbi:hypothetical protein P43SY_011672 [Pythium insidiosum]|uniref:Uncharacterized protein n=1 Tax=Pythium insidiosum TaxID=114742 RepID=A0AAD5L638_PYTIN|nr:hypothetical protein P43SY_011672 [Pythium insidiosum]